MNPAAAPERTFDTADALAQGVADWIVERANEPSGRSGDGGPPPQPEGRFALCLSGGSTPQRLYELLAAAPRRARLPWRRMHWFWGDERMVPHDDPASNYRMAYEALLRHVPVPPGNVHAIPTGPMSAAACATAYEADLQRFYGADQLDPGRPLFDLTLLGLGDDGHTASLFPGSTALDETRRWVVPVCGEASLDRITLTYPALASSRATAFLVAGAGKRDILARVRGGDVSLPAARLRPHGEVHWFTDRAAAAAPAMSGE